MVQDLCGRLIFVFMAHNAVAALPQIVRRRPGRCLQRRDCLCFLVSPARARQRLIFKDQEEPPRNGFARAELIDKAQIVLLQNPAMRVGFMLQFFSHRFHMPVNIRTLGQHFELYLDRRDLEVADEGVDDASLLRCAAQQEVDGDHLDNLDVAMVARIDNAVGDPLDRNVICQGVERLYALLFR